MVRRFQKKQSQRHPINRHLNRTRINIHIHIHIPTGSKTHILDHNRRQVRTIATLRMKDDSATATARFQLCIRSNRDRGGRVEARSRELVRLEDGEGVGQIIRGDLSRRIMIHPCVRRTCRRGESEIVELRGLEQALWWVDFVGAEDWGFFAEVDACLQVGQKLICF